MDRKLKGGEIKLKACKRIIKPAGTKIVPAFGLCS